MSLLYGWVTYQAVAASLRWYYPDQVHRDSSTPVTAMVAATSQPKSAPSSDLMFLF